MATTFLKRQKEMKRQEKQREKAERRAQRKLTGGTGNEISDDNSDVFGDDPLPGDVVGDVGNPEPAQG